MRTFASWEEVPIFDTEAAEAGFWSENRPDLRLMESAVAGGAEGSESVTITLRMDRGCWRASSAWPGRAI